MKKTNIAQYSIYNRMNDAEYIHHLENRIKTIDKQIEEFINLMDKSIFNRTGGKSDVMQVYAENIGLLRIKELE